MSKAYPVTAIRASAVVISTIIGVGVLSFPTYAARAADSGAPLMTLAAIGTALVCLCLLSMLARRFPQENIVQFSERLIGKWPARTMSALLILFFAMTVGISTRQFGEVVAAILLEKTPLDVTMIALLALVTVSSRRGIIKFSYIHSFYLQFILLVSIVLFFTSLKDWEFVNLFPLIGNRPTGYADGVLSITCFYQFAFILTLLVPFMNHPARILSATFWGVVISGVIFMMIITSTIAMFGAEETKLLIYPTLETVRTESISGGLLERMDGIFIIVWVVSVYTTLYSNYYFSVYAAKDLFRIKDHRMLATFLFPYVFCVAVLPHDLVQLYDFALKLYKYGLILTAGYPCMLLAIAVIRKIRGKTNVATG